MSVCSNLEAVRSTIKDSCLRAGRDPEEVTLLAVSKTKPAEDIMELYEAGHRDFGENYVQELREKHELLPKDIRWHMIGHLQKNKVKYIADFVAAIHSVDSRELADVIEKEAAKAGRVIPVLIEVNAGEEETKFGVSIEDAFDLACHILTLPHLKLEGLMTSAPFVDDPEEDRPVFRAMRTLMDSLNRRIFNTQGAGENALLSHADELRTLSMGMSNDYAVACEEGSTCVRVGSLIFGERHYS